jgi:hypothetical protein
MLGQAGQELLARDARGADDGDLQFVSHGLPFQKGPRL